MTTPSVAETAPTDADRQETIENNDDGGENKNETIILIDDDCSNDDGEGLKQHYDVILCGTGLIQSVLASALTRAGKTVLHCDAADYYGELDAVWTLPYLIQQYQSKTDHNTHSVGNETINFEGNSKMNEQSTIHDQNIPATMNTQSVYLNSKGSCLSSLKLHNLEIKTQFELNKGTKVSTTHGTGTITEWLQNLGTKSHPSDDSLSVIVTLDSWTLSNEKHPTIHIKVPIEVCLENNNIALTKYLEEQHHIVSVKTQQARTILQERSRSFAVDLSPSLIFAAGPAVDGLLQSSVADYLEFKSLEGMYWLDGNTSKNKNISQLERVPCNKSDVFTSPLLSPIDKRRLMKLLQLMLDYANNQIAENEALSLNEKQLNQGRSLARPQNKPLAADELSILKSYMESTKSDSDKEKTNAMTFEEYLGKQQQLSPKLQRIVRFALALEPGNYQPWTLQEGVRNLCRHLQALGKFGATGFLVPLYGSGELAQAFCRSAAVYGGTYLLRRAPLRVVLSDNSKDSNDKFMGVELANDDHSSSKVVAYTHVVAPLEISQSRPTHTVVRRVSVFRGKPLKDVFQHRHVVIVPPGSCDNDASIYALLLDETVNVTPHVPCGCTIIHWWTTIKDSSNSSDNINNNDDDDDDSKFSTLRKAHGALMSACQDDCDELLTATFSYSHYESTTEDDVPLHDNLHWIRRPLPGLELDAAFTTAAEIFTKICPGLNFLELADEINTAIKERFGDNDEDNERVILESAIGILEKKTETNNEEGSVNNVED